MEKNYNEMSSQEIEDEIIKEQNEISTMQEDLNKVLIEISEHDKSIIDLKEAKRKAYHTINNKKMIVENLEKIYKWRALRKERG